MKSGFFTDDYINGFDHVFCFLVSGLLINDIGRKTGLHWILRVLSMFVFIFLNTQYVNVSTLYSGVLFILAGVYSGLLLIESYQDSEHGSELWKAVPFGVFVAGLFTLKITFYIFTVVYVVLFFILCIWKYPERKRVLAGVWVVIIPLVLTVLPWMIGNGDKFSFIKNDLTNRIAGPSGKGGLPEARVEEKSFILKVCSIESSYGGFLSDYVVLFVFVGAASIVSLGKLTANKRFEVTPGLIVSAAVGGAAVISTVGLLKLVSVYGVAIRYLCPIYIAALPVIALLQCGPEGPSVFRIPDGRGRAAILSLAVGYMVILALFSDVFVARAKLAYDKRTVLSYRIDDQYIDTIRYSMGGGMRAWIRNVQSRSEPNQTIMVWISTPFHLDFQRNPIFTVGTWALVRPGGIPLKTVDRLSEYLRSLGVRYVMWEYRGDAKEGKRGRILLEDLLGGTKNRSHILFDDGRTVLFEIEAGDSPF